jgi:hypothetical protein
LQPQLLPQKLLPRQLLPQQSFPKNLFLQQLSPQKPLPKQEFPNKLFSRQLSLNPLQPQELLDKLLQREKLSVFRHPLFKKMRSKIGSKFCKSKPPLDIAGQVAGSFSIQFILKGQDCFKISRRI